jgi:signal peptidase I
MIKSKAALDASKKNKRDKDDKETTESGASATRETVESIVVAIILAFLFRTFVAEAFVIPTGSMAPTLQGRHKDVVCEKCGLQYRTGASEENDDDRRQLRVVVATTCPNCRYSMPLDIFGTSSHKTFTGDRILVSKFSFELAEPDRWDVFVFKYPGNAKQNYIKRLIGLPNETIRIRHGDIYVRKDGETEFRIARKPEHKMRAMLQLVDDSKFVPDELIEAGWPVRWQAWSPNGASANAAWTTDDHGRSFSTDGSAPRDAWLRYHHAIPDDEVWWFVENNKPLPDLGKWQGQLITDFYAYNAFTSVPPYEIDRGSYDPGRLPNEFFDSFDNVHFGSQNTRPMGYHWVGDLAVEAEIEIESASGKLLLKLVEGGINYRCTIDVEDGTATVSIEGGEADFVNESGGKFATRTAQTSVKRPGTYRLRFSNVDDELRLWVNNHAVVFDGPTTFLPPANLRPTWSEQDPGDLAPLGIGSNNLAMKVNRLQVLRDVYYVAVSNYWENQSSTTAYDYDNLAFDDGEEIMLTLNDPRSWATTGLFDARRTVEFSLGDNQFFPLGDNSPQSSDARLWNIHGPEPFVQRNLLTGKALVIYWPHAWHYIVPNFKRMGLIH